MKNKKVLFFDLDDTLITCSGYYDEVEKKIANEIYKHNKQYSIEEIRKKYNEIQEENVKKRGYGPENFTISAMQVASEIMGYDYFKLKIGDKIEEFTKVLFDLPVELIDGVEETIKYLHDKGYELNILTKGMEDVQRKRVENLAIKDYFNGYEIVKYKDKNDYLNVLNKYKLEPENCYMIGNSPKADINEAKLAGLNTIYIPNEYTWGYEEDGIIEEGPETKTLSRIEEMMNIL